MKINKIIYGVIRRDSYDGMEFVDMLTLSDSYDIAAQRGIETSKDNPVWSDANPRRRIGRFTLKEE